MLADVTGENIAFWICAAVVSCTFMVCVTIIYLKTGKWPW